MAASPRDSTLEMEVTVKEVAANRKIDVPKYEVLRRHISKARAGVLTQTAKDIGGLIIDHTTLDIPVDFGDGIPCRPICSFAIDAELEKVVALHLSKEPPSVTSSGAVILAAKSNEDLTEDRAEQQTSATLLLPAETDAKQTCDMFEDAGIALTIVPTHGYGFGQHVEALLGYYHEGIWFQPRMTAKPSTARPAQVDDPARIMTPTVAAAFVRSRLLTA